MRLNNFETYWVKRTDLSLTNLNNDNELNYTLNVIIKPYLKTKSKIVYNVI